MTNHTSSFSTSMSWSLPATAYVARVKPQVDAPVRTHIAARSNLCVTDVTSNNINQVRRLNAALFPETSSEEIYKQALDKDTNSLYQLALFNDIPVGDICCRVEDGSDPTKCKIYVMVIGVLAPYRRLGLATVLIKHIVNTAPPGSVFAGRRVESIYLHVQTSNEIARAFYERLGFALTQTIPSYYSHSEPTSAWVFEKRA